MTPIKEYIEKRIVNLKWQIEDIEAHIDGLIGAPDFIEHQLEIKKSILKEYEYLEKLLKEEKNNEY